MLAWQCEDSTKNLSRACVQPDQNWDSAGLQKSGVATDIAVQATEPDLIFSSADGSTHAVRCTCPFVLMHGSVLQHILGFLDILGSWHTFPVRQSLASTCRFLVKVGHHAEGDALIVSMLMSPTSWRAVQFAVESHDTFSVAIQILGDWSTLDTFRLGVAPSSLPLQGEDGHGCGFWISPRSGRLIGQDGSMQLLDGLRSQFVPHHSEAYVRGCQGAVHGPGFWVASYGRFFGSLQVFLLFRVV